MSRNQFRVEKTEGHLKRPGRSGNFGQNRGFSGGGVKGGGPSAPGPALSPSAAPLPSSAASHEFSTIRSNKKSVNGQGEQSRANLGTADSDEGNRAVPNGSRAIINSHGPSDGLESGSSKPPDSFNNKKAPRAVPKAPIPTEPTQSEISTPGDESAGPLLQFGTINPGIMNGMQIPARTCSAPPNLDEQKRHQAVHDSARAARAVLIPSAPKPQQAPQQPKQQHRVKDVGGANQIGNREPHPPTNPNRDMHPSITSTPNATPVRSSVLTMGGMPMHVPVAVPFQQTQITQQFRGPDMQIPTQGIVPSSLQMSMALPTGNIPQVPQPMFVTNIPSHSMQPQAIMHQGQSISFASHLGHQLPQLGSMGVGIGPQFHQQQPTNYVSQRKAVKITHPETHEELKLDKRTDCHTDVGASVQRQLPNAASQSQSHPTYSHSYFQPTYNTSQMYFAPQHPLSSAQRSAGPQTARYSSPVGQNGQTISFLNSSTLNPASGSRVGPPNTFHGLSEAVNSDVLSVSTSLAAPSQVTIKPPILSSSEKVGTPSVRISMPIAKPESVKKSKLPIDVSVAPQVRDNEVGPQNTATAQKKSSEPTVPESSSSSTDKDSIRASLMHVNNSESSSFVPTFAGSLASSVKENNEGKNEVFIRSESPKDQPKRINKSELKHSQQQIDSLEYTAEAFRGNGMASTAKDSPSIDSASFHSAPAADSFTSATALLPTIAEPRTSELDQKKDTVGSLESRAALNEEPLEAVSLNCSDDKVSIEAASYLEVSSSSTAVDGLTWVTSDISLDSSKGLEFEKIQENLTESECGIESYGNSSGCTSTKSNLTATSIDATAVIIMEVEKKAGSQLRDKDNGSYSEIVGTGVSDVPATTFSDRKDPELAPSALVPSTDGDGKISATDSSILKCEIASSKNAAAVEPTISSSEMSQILSDSEIKHKPEVDAADLTSGETPSVPPVSCGKSSLEPNRPNRITKKKTKNKHFSKADAATSDLYDAYKVPDEKLDTISTLETVEISSAVDSDRNTVENHDDVHAAVQFDEQSKPEFEDWESAADVSTPNLRSDNGKLIHVEKGMHAECRNESTGKITYSRDSLFSLRALCRDLPEGFDGSDAADILIRVHSGMAHDFDRDTLPSPGRVIDRSPGSSRVDRRMASDEDRWKFTPMNFRPVQGVNHGVLRNPRLQTSSQLYGGILSGPTQSLASQGGITRNSSDADRWQRAPGTQRGLMPPPQGSMQTIHRSANRYEIGRVSDEEEQKQRRLKAILNKLTPQNFEKLFTQVKEVNIDNTVTLTGVISQIFDKALMEPTFCEMYADFCHHLAVDLPDFTEDNQKITFRRLLLNKCQEEFERGEREEAEAEHAEEVGGTCQSEAEREASRIQTRRRMLGNIRLIGELYKKKMLTARIMHECIRKLLGQFQNPDEENIEALCKLMSTIGEMIDDQQSKESMDAYFIMMEKLSKIPSLSSRVRFMLKDTIDLRKNRWQQRRKVEGPKKIEDVHRDAAQERHAQERQAQTSRSARGPVISSKRGPPVDYGHRGSTTLNAPSSQLSGSSRALPGQSRGSSSQDFRLDDRNPLEGKVLSVPLPHRPAVGTTITLGPQGGLAKGMSSRGPGLMSNVPSTEIGYRSDSQRLASGSNGVSLTHDRIISTSRDESIPKNVPNRSLGATDDQTSFQDRNSAFGIRETHHIDQAFDGSDVATSGKRPGSSGGKMSISEPQQLSEDTLKGKSISTIREFYSAKDENEVVLCIRELNTPSFCPSMVSIWVSDSFERKSTDRSLLAQLLVNLTKGHSLISRPQLIEGFESVLFSLEDAVNDAPKAAEFLGHIFGKVIAENLVPLEEIGELILKGGEIPGSLIEAGLGSEILGSVLEFVKMEKGDSVLKEIQTSSNLQFEEFRPPRASSKSKKLDAFL
ncbi:Eukaryotic translation initiation factor 4G [Platanthera zijinensis]|uniref:Eukaryotic translation initiation factor 4G n=1 Tax=Platanthera zijinensis TaxID=2320716 RepID=A0AAP0FU78_9ASPA